MKFLQKRSLASTLFVVLTLAGAGQAAADSCVGITSGAAFTSCLMDLHEALGKAVADAGAKAALQPAGDAKTALGTACKKATATEAVEATEKTCRDKIKALGWTAKVEAAAKKELDRQKDILLASKSDDNRALSRLAEKLAARTEAVMAALKKAANDLVDKLDLKLEAGQAALCVDPAKDDQCLVYGRVDKALEAYGTTVGAAARKAAGEHQSKLIAAHTPSNEFTESSKEIQRVQDEAEREALARIRDQNRDGFVRSLTCYWMEPTDANPERATQLVCGTAGLVLSGSQESDLRIERLPAGAKVAAFTVEGSPVNAGAADEEKNANSREPSRGKVGKSGKESSPPPPKRASPDPCNRNSLSCATYGYDTLTVEKVFDTENQSDAQEGARVRSETIVTKPEIILKNQAVVIGVHRRVLESNYTTSYPEEYRQGDPVIHVFSKGRAPRLHVTVTSGEGETRTAEIPLEYPRFRIEPGGFIGFTQEVDRKVATRPSTSDPSKLVVDVIRDADSYSQETGVFVNFVPHNIPKLGFGLGFATNSDGPPSTYLGANFRLLTFGNRGLASIGGGIALRSVDRFPDLERRLAESTAELIVAPDSALLKAEKELREDWFISINLSFRFGPIGVPDDEK